MFGGRGFKVGSIAGIPIRLDPSWIWIAVLYTYTLHLNIEAGGAGGGGAWGLAIFSAALFFGSVLVHELAHAVMARALGIEVLGITLVFWGGYTQTRDRRGPMGELLVSAAGPASSLALGGIFWVISRALQGSEPAFAQAFGYVGWVNAFLAGLNSLPGLPLDGGIAFSALVWRITGSRRTAARAAGGVGMVVGAGFGAFALYALARGDVGLAIWGLLIGFWMISAARNAGQRESVREMLASGRVREAMRAPPPAVPADLTLSETLDRFLRGRDGEWFPVAEDGRVLGSISLDSARRVGGRDPMRPARDGMIPIDRVPTVAPSDTLLDALETLGPGRAGLVLEDGALVGSLQPQDVEGWLRRRVGSPTPPRPDVPAGP